MSRPWEVVNLPRARAAAVSASTNYLKTRLEMGTRMLELGNVPRSALPSDILRMARVARIENVASAQIIYDRFLPTGRVQLELTDKLHTQQAFKALEMSTIAAVRLTVTPLVPPPTLRQRQRGAEGRSEAARRGAVSALGDGPGAGVAANGRGVVLWGLPYTLEADRLAKHLAVLKLVGTKPNGDPMCDVTKLVAREKMASNYSRHYVQFESVNAAQTVVRRLHMTYFWPEIWRERFLMRARIVY